MKYSRADIAKGFMQQFDSQGLAKATNQLAALLLEQHLHGQLDEILDDIAREYARVHGHIEADVTTAFPLSADLKKQITQTVKNKTKATSVTLHEQIDRSLLGGVIITAPDMELDVSLKTKLAKLKA